MTSVRECSLIAATLLLMTAPVARAQPPAGASLTLGPVAGGDTYQLVSTAPSAPIGAGYLTVFDANAGQVRIVVSPTGRVGIGTTTPGYTLDVNGAINGTAVLVNGVAVGAGGTQWTSGSGGSISYGLGNVGV